MKLQISICLPRDAATVSIVRAIAADTLARIGVTDACVEDVRVALSEACNNVVQHARGTDDYEVRLDVNGAECTLSVVDTGHNLDASVNAEMPEPMSSRGRGLALMRTLTDRFDYIAGPETGTVARLVKYLDLETGSPLRPPG